MNGKSWSLPAGMLFQKYHCAKCGTRLKKEKTHRVVTQFDVDYYKYHDVGTYPKRDYDVYSYRFRCPHCNARISYEEQCTIKRIQKKQGSAVLSPSEIKMHYKACKNDENKGVLLGNIVLPLVFLLIFFVPFYFLRTNQTPKDLLGVALLYLIFAGYCVVAAIRKHKGKYNLKIHGTYSYEKETQLEKLQAYSSHNRQFVAVSQKCYCFYCMKSMEPDMIKSYTDDGETALCPYCGIDAVLPDGIDEHIDESVMREMHGYWF